MVTQIFSKEIVVEYETLNNIRHFQWLASNCFFVLIKVNDLSLFMKHTQTKHFIFRFQRILISNHE